MEKNLRSLRAIACLGLAMSVVGLAGCRSSGYTEASAQAHADRQLALDVADNLRGAPDTTFPDVAVRAHRGKVELRGFVADDAQRVEAERIAAQVPGVRRVDNTCRLTPAHQWAGRHPPEASFGIHRKSPIAETAFKALSPAELPRQTSE
jgi:hypothetical protein